MNWKRILNPWAALREAEAKIAVVEDRCEFYRERADDAEARAFRNAAEHYWQRNRMIEAQLEYTQKQMLEVVNLTPSPLSFVARTVDKEASS